MTLFKLKESAYYIPIIIFIIFLILIGNYLDRSAIAYAISPIKQTFNLNNVHFGLIGSAFGIGYLFMTIGGGVLVDFYKAHRVLTVSNIIWSIACTMIGLATGFWSLFILRFLLGIAEGPSFPAVTQVVAHWLPLSKRVRTMSFALASVPFASVIGAPLISHLIVLYNWRITFIILGVLGLLLAIVWYVFYQDFPKDRRQNSSIAVEEHFSKTSWGFILSNRSLLANNYAYFTYGYTFFFALIWLPGYLEQTYGLHLKQIGWFLIAPWLTATLLLIAGGFLSDRLLEKTKKLRIARSHIIWLCQGLSAICFIAVLISHTLISSLVFISLGLGFSLMPNAVFYSLNIDLAKDRAATSLGLMDCFFACGGILAPILTGFLSYMTGNFKAAIFLLISLTITSVLGIIFFQHPD